MFVTLEGGKAEGVHWPVHSLLHTPALTLMQTETTIHSLTRTFTLTYKEYGHIPYRAPSLSLTRIQTHAYTYTVTHSHREEGRTHSHTLALTRAQEWRAQVLTLTQQGTPICTLSQTRKVKG